MELFEFRGLSKLLTEKKGKQTKESCKTRNSEFNIVNVWSRNLAISLAGLPAHRAECNF